MRFACESARPYLAALFRLLLEGYMCDLETCIKCPLLHGPWHMFFVEIVSL